MTCNGNATEYCGAGNRLNVYQKNGTYIPTTSSSAASSTSSSAGSTTAPISVPTSTSGPQIKQIVSSNWAFRGCYTEGTNARALANITYASDSMTLESCAAFCVGNSMFGVEYARECYCANTLSTGSVLATTQADCSMTCKGDGTEYCGAGNRLQLYAFNAATSNSSTSSSRPTSTSSSLSISTSTSSSSSISGSLSTSSSSSTILSSAPTSTSSQVPTSSSSTSAPTGPTIVPSTGLYNYMGCYTEGTPGRAFSQLYANDSNTIAWCAQQCSAYTYFGAEYGRECWCGNSFGTGSTLTKDSDCSMTCGGDKTAYCGAGNRLSVYVKNGTSVNALSSSSVVLSSSSSSQISISSSISSTTSQIPTSSTSTQAPTTSISSSSSSQSSTTSLGSSSSTSLTSSATSTQTAPAIKPTIGAYTYKGCYTEATNMRALSVSSNVNYTSMTLENCATFCSGSTMWGVEYGGECYCGNFLNPGSVVAPNTDCSFACPGSKLEYCGAGNRLSVYSLSPVGVGSSSSSQSSSSSTQSTSTSQSSSSSKIQSTLTSQSTSSSVLSSTTSQTTTSTVQSISTSSTSASSSSSSTSSAQPTPTGPFVSQGNVNFTYYSCVSEPSSGRLLSTQVENNGTYMTIEKCLSNCYNYAYAGVEYGRECWCGNTLNTAPGFMNTTDSDCSFTCPGNSTEFCGAGNRLNLYWFDAAKAKMNSGS